MRVGRRRLFIRRFRPRRDAETENVEGCRDARGGVRKAPEGPGKTSPQGIHSKARSADVHEYCQNDGRPEMIDRRRCPEITDRSCHVLRCRLSESSSTGSGDSLLSFSP